MPKVTLEVDSVTNNTAARTFVEELANQYADLSVANIKVGANQITFDVIAQGMEDTSVDDIKNRMNEYISMNVPPFNIKNVRVS